MLAAGLLTCLCSKHLPAPKCSGYGLELRKDSQQRDCTGLSPVSLLKDGFGTMAEAMSYRLQGAKIMIIPEKSFGKGFKVCKLRTARLEYGHWIWGNSVSGLNTPFALN